METIFRDYESKDYLQCETLVNDAWEFDKNFKPQGLSDIAKLIYTKGSVINSNFRRVIEIDGRVVGFIFGLNENANKPKSGFLFELKIIWKLLQVKPTRPSSRKELLNAFHVHENNRSKLVDKGRSEIILFVVEKHFRGQGFGKELWSEFHSHCQESLVKSIIVETNTDGASAFYEKLGFEVIGNFYSPVHQFAAPNSRACIYEYRYQ